jgi:hypothetical protein
MIPNYNYREFVGDAIESRLEIDWPDKEVIVAQKYRRFYRRSLYDNNMRGVPT